MKKVGAILIPLFLFGAASSSFCQQDKYSLQEKEYLLSLARQSLVWYLKYNQTPRVNPEELSDNLKEKRPCFVTLEKNGALRGCIGLFEFERPLYENVISRSLAAATQDYRFAPVRYEELRDITIEISVLTEPGELKFNSAADLLNKLHPFEDGVIISTPYGSSTYLPQVWEVLPQKEQFLSELCLKHGASADYWMKNYQNTRVEIYHAIHFKEEAAGRQIVGPAGAVVGDRGGRVLGRVSFGRTSLGSSVHKGAVLEPGTILTEDSDIADKK